MSPNYQQRDPLYLGLLKAMFLISNIQTNVGGNSKPISRFQIRSKYR